MTALVQFNTLVASIQQNGKECEDSLRRGYIGETCEASFIAVSSQKQANTAVWF